MMDLSVSTHTHYMLSITIIVPRKKYTSFCNMKNDVCVCVCVCCFNPVYYYNYKDQHGLIQDKCVRCL